MLNIYTRSLMAAAALSVGPLATGFAQTRTPSTAGSGYVAGPTYPANQDADPALDPRLRNQAMTVPPSENPRVPGATGMVVVPGNNSTIASDRSGSVDQKTGQQDDQSSGGSN